VKDFLHAGKTNNSLIAFFLLRVESKEAERTYLTRTSIAIPLI
jgi:hypothetical protein